MTSATESAVKVTILPKQKKETTIIHAKNSEKVPVMTSAKQGAVFENSEKVRAQTKVQFIDHFTLAKKEDDGYTRILPQQKKKETAIIHAKNSEKVRAQTKVQF